jgi:hypothetical protein
MSSQGFLTHPLFILHVMSFLGPWLAGATLHHRCHDRAPMFQWFQLLDNIGLWESSTRPLEWRFLFKRAEVCLRGREEDFQEPHVEFLAVP